MQQLCSLSSRLGPKDWVTPQVGVPLVSEIDWGMLRDELDLQITNKVPTWIDGFKSWRLEYADMFTFVEESQ